MTEQELADQFGQDIDDLLQGHCPDRASAAPEYCSALDLAQVLATADLSTAGQQRLALRHSLLSQINAPTGLASTRAKPLAALARPLVRSVPAMVGVLLAIGVIHLAWSGELHRGASDFSSALRENLTSVYANLPAIGPEFAAPITMTVGLAPSPWLALSSPEALATSQVPANSTTVALGSVTVLGSPPK
jgi:hypothetical protein